MRVPFSWDFVVSTVWNIGSFGLYQSPVTSMYSPRIGIWRGIRRESPLTKVLKLASEVREEELLASIMAGASGYIAMNARRPELVSAVHIVAGGGYHFESFIAQGVLGEPCMALWPGGGSPEAVPAPG